MVYCQRCGTKNDDDAKFCKNCSTSLRGARKEFDKEWENKCERECHEGTKTPIFWGIIIILIGLFIIFEFALDRLPEIPGWLRNFPFCGVAALIIGLIIVAIGVKVITRD